MSYYNFPLILVLCIEATERGPKDCVMTALEVSASHNMASKASPSNIISTVSLSHTLVPDKGNQKLLTDNIPLNTRLE
jgi:hypothetical protein